MTDIHHFNLDTILKSYSRKWCTGEIDMMG
jgi:hypothetical protein